MVRLAAHDMGRQTDCGSQPGDEKRLDRIGTQYDRTQHGNGHRSIDPGNDAGRDATSRPVTLQRGKTAKVTIEVGIKRRSIAGLRQFRYSSRSF